MQDLTVRELVKELESIQRDEWELPQQSSFLAELEKPLELLRVRYEVAKQLVAKRMAQR